jgi:hypothetical protein
MALGSEPPPNPAPGTDDAAQRHRHNEWLQETPRSFNTYDEVIQKLLKEMLGHDPIPIGNPIGDPLPPPRKRQYVSPMDFA